MLTSEEGESSGISSIGLLNIQSATVELRPPTPSSLRATSRTEARIKFESRFGSCCVLFLGRRVEGKVCMVRTE